MKKFILINCLILVICIVIGIFTKNSYSNAFKSTGNYSNYAVMYYMDDLGDSTNQTKDKLVNAPFIAKVVFTGNRVPMYTSMLSTVKVIKVYKGNQKLVNKEIKLYEINFFDSKNKLYRNYSLSNLMNDGKEYYVFAKEKEFAKGSKVSIPVFSPISVELSVFPTGKIDDKMYNSEDIIHKKVSYDDIKNNAFLLNSKSSYDTITNLTNEIKIWLGGN